MSLKMPGVGSKIEEYQYYISKDNQNAVCVAIKYVKPDTTAKRVQKFLKSDQIQDGLILIELLRF